VELALGIADVELHERAGQRLHLPGRGGLAGAQPDDGIADPDRLARLQRHVARQAVALVEEAEDRDALRHRRGSRRLGGDGLRNVDRPWLGRPALLPGLVLRLGSATGQQEQAGGDGRLGPAAHPSPGVQAS
jgi:hypothetical protein